ncbi:MAG: BlaI/MecI/CopY family transcriptional regulator [Oscillospiraceae bacterium]|nr:BlaI/MecI/CopY family transcriptional regulator [Oscillospiraceae bacterium]
MKISGSELEVMRLIWALERPVTAQELLKQLEEKQWKITTLLTFLSRLCDKSVLACEKEGRANHYRPLLSQEEYQQMETAEFMEQVHSGSVQSLFAALYKSKGLTRADLDELSRWLEEQ